ncbi:MAG: hypothetical protein ACE5I7_17255 [Candidatus Binatia bacterium]
MNRTCARACAGMLAGVLAWAVTACSRHGSESGAAEFFPLHTEDTWVYEVAQPLRNVRTRMTVRVRDERYIQALGQRCRLVDETYAGVDAAVETLHGPHVAALLGRRKKPEVYPIAYCHRNGFLYRALSLQYQGDELRDIGLGSREERFLPDGLASDLTWESVTTAYDLGRGNGYGVRQTHRATLESSIIEVPAGQFAGCVRVETVAVHSGKRDGEYDSDPIVLYYADWYAPNVGLVRTMQWERPDGGPPLARIELVAYDVQGAHH